MRNWRNTLRMLSRRPWLHFVTLGGILFLLRAGLGPELPAQPAQTDDELLYREALRLRLDRELPAQRRLIQNMRFLGVDAQASDGELVRQARALGFHRTDPVVRRYMIEKMRLLARAGRDPDVFSEAELEAYLRAHAERFSIPPFVRLTHVFLSTDSRGAAAATEAERLLAQLRAERVNPEAAPAFGDPFPLGNHTAMIAASDLQRIYGTGFASAVMRLPVGVWSGPIASAQGLHLVWIREARPATLAPLADVHSRLVLALAAERAEARLAAYLKRLRARPTVIGDSP